MKIVIDMEDGSGPKEWAPVSVAPSEVVHVVPGEVLEVVADAASEAPAA